ncbi:hypothetical protein ACQEVC_44155 [Plantactinospora sp. CA-294935]
MNALDSRVAGNPHEEGAGMSEHSERIVGLSTDVPQGGTERSGVQA